MPRRFLEWWNRHQRLADALLATVACVYLLIEVPYHEQTIADLDRVPLSFWGDLLAYASLAWRRRNTVAVLALVWALWLLSGRWDIWTEWNASWAELSTPTALMFMSYTAGRWSSSRWAGLFIIATLLPVAPVTVQQVFGPDTLPFPLPAVPTPLLVTSFVLCTGAWGLGRLRRSESEAITRGEESRVQAVLAEERIRIARELHDIVAHNVSAMVIHSDGAAAALLDQDVDEAGQAVDAIGASGRATLRELRLLLGLLRDAPMAPQPSIDAIKDLAERLPMEVRLHVSGQVREAPPALGLAAYRIVQEALTNTLKHAGKGAKADVSLRYADDGLHIQITDDGGGRIRRRAGSLSWSGSGQGLVGMRERAAMLGGTVRVASPPPSGFQVEATLPWT
ncbi:sensor histidine kinase [Nonomuraea sp. NPDC049400]|uniref:sensor histidine kinase n=1 Tax=Nonomuraea sp. NPDC049400 TaxID=3364352 RepID=UPI0037B2F37C